MCARWCSQQYTTHIFSCFLKRPPYGSREEHFLPRLFVCARATPPVNRQWREEGVCVHPRGNMSQVQQQWLISRLNDNKAPAEERGVMFSLPYTYIWCAFALSGSQKRRQAFVSCSHVLVPCSHLALPNQPFSLAAPSHTLSVNRQTTKVAVFPHSLRTRMVRKIHRRSHLACYIHSLTQFVC